MLILNYAQAKDSILIKFFFERKGHHHKTEAYYTNGFARGDIKHNEDPAVVIPHLPANYYLACYVHWIGTDRPQQIAIFDKETKEDIHRYVAARRKENVGIAWYYVPQSRYEVLKKELEDMQKKAQAEQQRLALAREQKERTAKLAKKMGEREKLVLNTDDEFADEKSESCCCSCWWR